MECLSDDENNQNIAQGSRPEPPPPPPPVPRRPAQGFRARSEAENLNTADPRKLSYLIRGKCGCKCKCFLPFQKDPLQQQWVALRKTMSKMTKLEKDNHVLNSVVVHLSNGVPCLFQSIQLYNTISFPMSRSIHRSGLRTKGVPDAEGPENGSLPRFKAHPHLGAARVQQGIPKDDGGR